MFFVRPIARDDLPAVLADYERHLVSERDLVAAMALLDLVRALKSVDFPTFGSPTIPIFIA